jgi:UDP-N-acetylglucosamine--N-acetylmuramyl-(pentapeptide) pyrophosphoryl-undecaprenol N-acetylglucosamine transferase
VNTAETFDLGVVVAGGGTGGHLFPGIAVAQQFTATVPETRVLFVGTDRPFEAAAVKRAGFSHRVVRVEGIKGRGWKRAAGAMFKLPRAILESIKIIAEFRPHLIFGVGGYASGPTVAAGWLAGKTVVLQEQNLLPGIANRLLSMLAQRIYLSFPETAARFPAAKARVLGNPVRKEVLESARRVPAMRSEKMTVLILGGSQGARSINTAVVEALIHLRHPERIRFIHQSGEADENRVRAAYAQGGIEADARAFFHDVGRVFAAADLVICRAGATTVAELTAVGKAIVFIPFPYAADDHQTKNALSLVRREAAELIPESELTGAMLAERIEDYAARPEARAQMAERASAFGRPEAAESIVHDCLELLAERNVWPPHKEPKTDDG